MAAVNLGPWSGGLRRRLDAWKVERHNNGADHLGKSYSEAVQSRRHGARKAGLQ